MIKDQNIRAHIQVGVKKPIFILGIPRCGSTLWTKILENNESLLRIREMHFLSPWHKDFRNFCNNHIGDLKQNKHVYNLMEYLFSNKENYIHGTFWNDLKKINDISFKKKILKSILKSNRSFGNIFKILIEEYTSFNDYNRCFVKFPVYFSYLSELLTWYPECKIIHITRDPRAIAISKTNDPGGTSIMIKNHPYYKELIKKSMIYFVVTQYIWSSSIHIKYKNLDNYALFRYEDLLLNPKKVIKDLCSFIEIDFNERMLYPGPEQPSSITGKTASGFDKNAAIRWKNEISKFDDKLITLLTKKYMRQLGYYPDKHPIFRTRAHNYIGCNYSRNNDTT